MPMFNKAGSVARVARLNTWRTRRLRDAAPTPDTRVNEIASYSHELRNSLAVVRNAAALLRSPAAPATIERTRSLIERHVAQMNRLIEDMLNSASNPAGKPDTLQCSHLDLRTVVQYAVDSIAPDMAQRAHRLVVNLPDDAIWVHVDDSRLEQAFSNLLINAAKYTPNGGEVMVTLERQATHARLRISDSGIGIEAAMLRRVFEMYAQADASAACSEGGSGIGLALVRDLVEKHGGTVQATSGGLGCGSEFTVMVPVLWASPTHATTSPTS
jgi:signal transduction histidine kinase